MNLSYLARESFCLDSGTELSCKRTKIPEPLHPKTVAANPGARENGALMRNPKRLAPSKIFAVLLLVFGTFSSFGVTKTTTAAGGNWNTGSTWSGGAVPANGDDAIILAGASVTVTANATIKSVTFSNNSPSTATLAVNSGVILT